MTVICTGRTEKKLDLLSTEKNDYAFCDCSAVIHKTSFYLNVLANEVIFVLLHCTLVNLNLVIVMYYGLVLM